MSNMALCTLTVTIQELLNFYVEFRNDRGHDGHGEVMWLLDDSTLNTILGAYHTFSVVKDSITYISDQWNPAMTSGTAITLAVHSGALSGFVVGLLAVAIGIAVYVFVFILLFILLSSW